MDYETKLLDIEYLKIRISELDDVKNGGVRFVIYKSNNPKSKSVYVRFYINYKKTSIGLRISDHYNKRVYDKRLMKQFIIRPESNLSKRRLNLFIRTLKSSINELIVKRKIFLQKSFDKFI